MRLAALVCVLACVVIFPGAVRGDDTGPTPAPTAGTSPVPADSAQVPGPARILDPDAALAMSTLDVDAELGTVDGGSLTRALARAARQGRELRILLDPYDKDSRMQGAALEGAGPAVRIRWQPGMSNRRRWMSLQGLGWLTWTEGRKPVLTPPPYTGGFFAGDWGRAWRSLPRALRLRDQLEALPDPRETSPHYVSRVSGGVP